ncbi:13429_t:CDS:2, partial [Funneliformis mosseae]
VYIYNLGVYLHFIDFDRKDKVVFKVTIDDIFKVPGDLKAVYVMFAIAEFESIFSFSQYMNLDNSHFEVKNESELECNLRPSVEKDLKDNKYVC